jgi:hypothetical protein
MLADAQITRTGKGTTCAAMLLGVKPELRADLGRLAVYTRRLRDLASRPMSRQVTYTPGILRTEWTPVERAVEGGVDLRAIQEEVEFIFSHHAFRGVIFFPTLRGAGSSGEGAVYLGLITNMSEDDKGAVPKPQSIANKAAPLAQALKKPGQVENSMLQQAKQSLDQKLPLLQNRQVQQLSSFGLGELGPRPTPIGQVVGLGQQGSGASGYLGKAADLGLHELMSGGRNLKGDLLGSATGLAMNNMFSGQVNNVVAPAAIALVSSRNVNQLLTNEIGANAPLAGVAFNDLGQKIGVPAPANAFLLGNAPAILRGDWQTLTTSAALSQLGGGPVTRMAAGAVMEKMLGQPTTTSALVRLGAPGLKSIVDSGNPVVASGKAGSAAVTGMATDPTTGAPTTVTVHDGAAPKTLSMPDFMSKFSTISSVGIF